MIKIRITIKSCGYKVAAGGEKEKSRAKNGPLPGLKRTIPTEEPRDKALLVGRGCSRSRVGAVGGRCRAVTIAAASEHAEHPQ
jgi:hypothetical protein